MGGRERERVSTSRDGSLKGRISKRFNPMAIATKLTAIGRASPICINARHM